MSSFSVPRPVPRIRLVPPSPPGVTQEESWRCEAKSPPRFFLQDSHASTGPAVQLLKRRLGLDKLQALGVGVMLKEHCANTDSAGLGWLADSDADELASIVGLAGKVDAEALLDACTEAGMVHRDQHGHLWINGIQSAFKYTDRQVLADNIRTEHMEGLARFKEATAKRARRHAQREAAAAAQPSVQGIRVPDSYRTPAGQPLATPPADAFKRTIPPMPGVGAPDRVRTPTGQPPLTPPLDAFKRTIPSLLSNLPDKRSEAVLQDGRHSPFGPDGAKGLAHVDEGGGPPMGPTNPSFAIDKPFAKRPTGIPHERMAREGQKVAAPKPAKARSAPMHEPPADDEGYWDSLLQAPPQLRNRPQRPCKPCEPPKAAPVPRPPPKAAAALVCVPMPAPRPPPPLTQRVPHRDLASWQKALPVGPNGRPSLPEPRKAPPPEIVTSVPPAADTVAVCGKEDEFDVAAALAQPPVKPKVDDDGTLDGTELSREANAERIRKLMSFMETRMPAPLPTGKRRGRQDES